MQIVVTPSPHPLVTRADEVFEEVNRRLMEEIKKADHEVSVDNMEVSIKLDEKEEKLFAKQDLEMTIDRTITYRYVDILDEVVNRLK